MKHTSKPQINVGDTFKTNCHGVVEVIYYNHANDIGVRFDNGYERSTTSGNLQKGKVKDPTSPVRTNKRRSDDQEIVIGKEYKNTQGFTFKPVKYISASEIVIEFSSGYSSTVTSQNIRKGGVFDFLSPSKLGVGILGVGDYETDSRKGHESLEYKHWSSMLARCYDVGYREKFPTYKNVTMCSEWLNFQTFAKWCNKQVGFGLEGFVLDKDILVKGNKVYSPTTCAFVHNQINALFVKSDAMRGDYPIGVYFATKNGKLGACLREYGKNRHLGFFTNELDAFESYKTNKEKYIKVVADQYKHLISEKCYEALYNYQVEITD